MDLKELLSSLDFSTDDPRLILGPKDDAGVYEVAPGLLLVQTVDFFTPVVDGAFDFGAVAAANALSDVYAMGATPHTCLSVVGFPMDDLDKGLLTGMMEGVLATVREAGALLVGGHTIDDPIPKCGLAVTGTVTRQGLWTKAGARPGDVLCLTKPVGTGILIKALKDGTLSAQEETALVESMRRLNRRAAETAGRHTVHAATDVTGFGLMGHLLEMAEASGVSLEIDAAAVPVLPGAQDRAQSPDAFPQGSRDNFAYVSPRVSFDPKVSTALRHLLADAVTSGGLVLSVPEQTFSALQDEDAPLFAPIGRVSGPGAPSLRVR